MSRALIKITIFAIILIVVDSLSFFPFNYLKERAKDGTIKRSYYICNNLNADVIIMGSSRARHHYDPKILEDSFHMSCYNAGLDGNGIISMYGRYKMLTKRYTPRLIIYDVHQQFDLYEGDNTKYLSYLRDFYNVGNGVDSLILSVDPNERYKHYSNLYLNNSKLFELISDNSSAANGNIYNGYLPIKDTMKYKPICSEKSIRYKTDTLKLYYFEKLMKDCKGKTKLVFVESPRYISGDDAVFQPIKKLCVKYRIPFYDHYLDKKITSNKALFYDSGHLNRAGSILYTKEVASEIKKYLNIK
jgi:hypothetical protein